LSTVRFPDFVWDSVERVGFVFGLCDSVVAVQDLLASLV